MKAFILSGGGGTRLFPLSRDKYPKQFLKIFDGESLIQKTVKRILKHVKSIDNCIFLTNKEYTYHIKSQISEFYKCTLCEPKNIIQEPVKRNTAPAIALGIVWMLENNIANNDETVIVLPSDHLISPEAKFIEYVQLAEYAAKLGFIVTFGIKPFRPETGYGYIEASANKVEENIFYVKSFHEKPKYEIAQQYLNKGSFYWNSGIFCFTVKTFLSELEKFNPQIYNLIKDKTYKEVVENFEKMPDISIDYAIMEKTDKAVVIPADLNWSDLGSFDSIYDVLPKDESNNVVLGNSVLIDSLDNLIISNNQLVAGIGVRDMLIIQTPDFLLVSKRGESQKVKNLYNILSQKEDMKEMISSHVTDYRPWGSYTVLDKGERYKIKRITVKPGESLSLQMHYHRSEHWVVVKGTALVITEEDGQLREHYVRENESFFIPKTVKHRLKNPGKVMLEIIEIQSGEYLGEDDIVRFEDKYSRS